VIIAVDRNARVSSSWRHHPRRRRPNSVARAVPCRIGRAHGPFRPGSLGGSCDGARRWMGSGEGERKRQREADLSTPRFGILLYGTCKPRCPWVLRRRRRRRWWL
jgi:hypothetical protein